MSESLPDYEKLGVFYLGRRYDLKAKAPLDDLVLFPSKNLVTHGLVVGMTGSGKTGLCFDLIEEAAMDKIPSIIIDPKGDLANLMLLFPELRPEDFRPWVEADDAAKAGLSVDDFARQQAETWKKGLADSKQGPERIRRLLDQADFALYTPGSSAGRQVSVLKSFDCPPEEVLEDGELLREHVGTTVASLLQLVGISADSVKSRESVFLTNILQQAWSDGRSLDLAGLIAEVQNPAVKKVGVLDVDTFFPAKERFELAMQLNNLLASPNFKSWMTGEPLDIGRLMTSPTGKPRVAIFSIAHLGDNERMFFVTMLLNQMLAWMRAQSGTSSLRALLYMDEIFGYFPPIANPPSKTPLLTLLKQARAFGLGVVLATQNPVDIDYKGLANIGTWFIGRLQTERDKARILEGLEGAAAAQGGRFNRGEMDQLLSALTGRVFLLHSVHSDEHVLLQSRWAMSYLRGPMARSQIKALTASLAQPVDPAPASGAKPVAMARPEAGSRPVVPPDITQLHVTPNAKGRVVYQPRLVGAAHVRFVDKKNEIDLQNAVVSFFRPSDGPVPVDWENAEDPGLTIDDLAAGPPEGAFAECPAPALQPKNYAKWSKDFANWVYGNCRLSLYSYDDGDVSLTSDGVEDEKKFRERLRHALREARDAAVEALQAKYAKEFAKLEERIRKAEQAVENKQAQARTSTVGTVINFGSTVLGSIFGGRKVVTAGNISKAATAARSASRTLQQNQSVEAAQENLDVERQKLEDLHAQMTREIDEMTARLNDANVTLETKEIKPTKTNISVRLFGLAWAPFVVDDKGIATPAFGRS